MDIVVLDMAWKIQPADQGFHPGTGRLHPEDLQFLEKGQESITAFS